MASAGCRGPGRVVRLGLRLGLCGQHSGGNRNGAEKTGMTQEPHTACEARICEGERHISGIEARGPAAPSVY